MKLRSVALVGVMSLAVLGLIGTGAHAVFTTSTTSSQTITAGTWGAPPTVAITYPVNNTTYGSNWTGSITGTASSNSGSGTSITAVSVAIEDTATGQWWNGTSFSAAAQTLVTASGTTNWSLALAGSSLSTGDTYSVVAQATDSLGYVGTSSTVSFTYCLKTSPPTLIITYPVNNTTYGSNWGGAITGTASAGAGATISKVKVSIQQVGGSCWTGSGDTYTATCPNYVAVTSGTTNWSLTVPNADLTSGDRYKVTAQATDSLGYVGTSSTVSFTYCLKTSPPTLTITASSGSMTYGGTVPAITPSYSGFVNGDTATSLTTAPTCSTTATNSSPAGPYPSSCSGAVDPNYTITYVPGTLTVNASGAPPTLTITASSGSMTYGGTVPTVTPSYSGFVNGDTPASLTDAPTCSTTAASSSPAGPYPSSCTGAVDANYTISYVAGSVSVGPAPSSTGVTNSAPTGLSTSATFTYTATVSGPGVTPTGTVIWTLTGPGSPTCSASTLSSGGLATCTITGVAVGNYTAKATYGGDTNHTGSSGQDNLSAYQFTSTLVQTVTVTTPGPTITVTSPGKGGPPRILGKVQPEIYLAAVEPWTLLSHQTVHLKIHLWGRRGTVTGTVKLLLGKKLLCAPKLVKGRGRCTLSSSKIGRGRHYLLLMYSGSSQYLAVIHHVNVYVHPLASPRTGR
ncbi:MAG: MBG domain-containing protein [Acidimicrobiales bacterium]